MLSGTMYEYGLTGYVLRFSTILSIPSFARPLRIIGCGTLPSTLMSWRVNFPSRLIHATKTSYRLPRYLFIQITSSSPFFKVTTHTKSIIFLEMITEHINSSMICQGSQPLCEFSTVPIHVPFRHGISS